jgi:hypothetical protein
MSWEVRTSETWPQIVRATWSEDKERGVWRLGLAFGVWRLAFGVWPEGPRKLSPGFTWVNQNKRVQPCKGEEKEKAPIGVYPQKSPKSFRRFAAPLSDARTGRWPLREPPRLKRGLSFLGSSGRQTPNAERRRTPNAKCQTRSDPTLRPPMFPVLRDA